ncbi:MAG TPA: hydroxymyristoyl-ACP dehydratase [Gemmata sp.]
MRFHLIDRIDRCEPGKSLAATKFLALGEEYLKDHFPQFPVMPGVLMLQSCVEAASHLWRASTGYKHPVIVLRELKSVKYGTFMLPGHLMNVTVELTKTDPAAGTATFKAEGTNEARESTVKANFVLHGYSLAERGPTGAATDAKLVDHWKARWALLTGELRG